MQRKTGSGPGNDKIATDKLNRGSLIDPRLPLILERSILAEALVEWGLANLAVVATVAMTRRNRCTAVVVVVVVVVDANPFSFGKGS